MLSEYNVSMRRASAPMEIIIGADGRPVFTASPPSPPSPSGSPGSNHKEDRPGERKPTLTRAETMHETSTERSSRRTSSNSRTKPKTRADSHSKSSKRPDKESPKRRKPSRKYKGSSEDKESDDVTSVAAGLATCFVGPTETRSKTIDVNSLEADYVLERAATVTVRNTLVQTDGVGKGSHSPSRVEIRG